MTVTVIDKPHDEHRKEVLACLHEAAAAVAMLPDLSGFAVCGWDKDGVPLTVCEPGTILPSLAGEFVRQCVDEALADLDD